MIGTSIGNYRIEGKLGEGGMGVVYRATDTELDRPVAIKTLLAGTDEESLARFMREAKAASRLQHPAIVTIHHWGVEGDARYIVMEYIEGKTLKKIINGRPMPINQVCEIAIQVADGLAMAHEKGITHRDMKAENVMVTPRGQVKILDFGLAKLKEPETLTGEEATAVFKTQAGIVMGTVSHMSPEQALGSEVDTRSDIFSFGVVLYEMVTGLMPFEAPTPQATMARILNQHPTPVTGLNPEAPPEVEKLIQHCLQKDRALRPTANEIIARLKAIQASLSATSISSPDIRRAAGTGSGPTAAATPSAGTPLFTPSVAIPAAAPPTIVIRPPSGGAEAARLEPVKGSDKAVYYITRTFRIAFAIATLTVPLSFVAYFVISGGLIRPQVVEGTAVMAYIRAIVGPSLRLAENLFTFRTVVGGWNFMLLGLGAVTFVLRQLLLIPVEHAEHRFKTKLVRTRAAAPVAMSMTATERASSSRLSMLREYAEAKRVLFQEKKHLSFLSIDVVGSTRMKVGEDKLVVEHAFSEYRKFVDRILKASNVWKTAWTPDGIMAAFFIADDAVKAGKEVLRGLPWFNDGVHQLKTPFAVRIGINSGEVVFPDGKSMEEINDHIIDVAGHMQKYAQPGSVWVPREVLAELTDQTGFRAITEQQVDGHSVLEWRPEDASERPSGRAAAASD